MYAKLAEAEYADAKDEDVIYNIMMRLEEMSNTLRKKAGQKQRELSGSVTPYIQSCLSSMYNNCSLEKGKGMFQRIKDKVYADIYMLKDTMFRTAVEEVTKGLDALKVIILEIIMRKPAFRIYESKGTDQLRSNCAADQRLCFHYIDSTIPLLSKYEISNL